MITSVSKTYPAYKIGSRSSENKDQKILGSEGNSEIKGKAAENNRTKCDDTDNSLIKSERAAAEDFAKKNNIKLGSDEYKIDNKTKSKMYYKEVFKGIKDVATVYLKSIGKDDDYIQENLKEQEKNLCFDKTDGTLYNKENEYYDSNTKIVYSDPVAVAWHKQYGTTSSDNYDEYFNDFVNKMKGIDSSTKSGIKDSIMEAINCATNVNNLGGNNIEDCLYDINYSHANLELKYISKNLIPKKYQAKFNSIADKFTNDFTNNYNYIYKNLYTAFANSNYEDLKEMGNEKLTKYEKGTSAVQVSKNTYEHMYKNINLDTDDLGRKLNLIYNTLTDSHLDDDIIGTQFKNMPQNIQLVKDIKNKEIDSLKSSWNSVVNLVDEVKNSHIKTSIDAVV